MINTKLKERGLQHWDSKTLDMERVFFKFSSKAEDEIKNRLQSLDENKEIEENNVLMADFPTLVNEIDSCREEIEDGQGFVILESIEGLAYNEIQFYCWTISNLLGDPLAQDQFGRRLIHIYDRDSSKQIKDGARYHQTHESGAIHTDNVNIPEPWDYLLVGCVIPAMIGGENIIVNGLGVHDYLHENASWDLGILRKNFFWECRGVSNKLYQAPIISYNDAGEPMFRYLRTYLESAHVKAKQPLTHNQRHALDTLDAALSMSEFQIKYRLKEGQIFVANDNRIFHDRECFVDYQDSISVEDKKAGKEGVLRRTLERTWIKK